MEPRRETLMDCPHCGEKIKEGALKCRYCREFVSESVDRNILVSKVKPDKEKKPKYFKIFILLLIYFVSLGIFFYAYNSVYDSPTDSTTTDSGAIKPVEEYNRLRNGETVAIKNNYFNGNGELTIKNGTDSDAILKMIDESAERSIISIYIRSNESATVESIEDGKYQLYVTSGRDYNSEEKTFNLSRAYYVFDKASTFETSTESYTTYSITLHQVINGNATTSGISEEEFNRY